jgi:hypothetical protein
MKINGKLGELLYGFALAASLVGARMLLTGFLLGADWNFGVHVLRVLYFLLSFLGTLGLLVATFTFWSNRAIFKKIGLVSSVETLLFASVLAFAFLFDRHRDYSPMIVGLSRSLSISVSSIAWFAIPVATSLIGTYASLLRIKELSKSEVTPWPR